jgi:hypothetical protein
MIKIMKYTSPMRSFDMTNIVNCSLSNIKLMLTYTQLTLL